jgi:hypothetical protein
MKESQFTRAEVLDAVRANRGQLQYTHRLLSEIAATQPRMSAPAYEPWAMVIAERAMHRASKTGKMVEEVVKDLLDVCLRSVLENSTRKH